MPQLVSIVMPCYNAAAHLPASVDSVLAEEFVGNIADDGYLTATLEDVV